MDYTTGNKQEFAAGQRIPFIAIDSLWYIEKGEIELYLLNAHGPLTFLFSSGVGSTVFPFSPIDDGYRILALATCPTTIYSLPRTFIETNELELHKWIYTLSNRFEKFRPLSITYHLGKDFPSFECLDKEVASVPRFIQLEEQYAILWITISEGKGQFLNTPGIELLPGDPPFPLTPTSWLQADGLLKGQIQSTNSKDKMLEGLDFFHKIFLKVLDHELVLQHQKEQTQVSDKLSQYNKSARRSLANEASSLCHDRSDRKSSFTRQCQYP